MKFIAFEGTVSRNDSATNTFILSNIRQETDLRHILNSNDIVEIDDYFYVIDAVSAPSNQTQSFTIKAYKTRDASTWTINTVAQDIDGKTLYLSPYTGVINTTLSPDTEIDYTTNRMTIGGHTISKTETILNSSRLVSGLFNSHENKIDYGDRDNKFIKIQDSNRKFYQNLASVIDRFYYYRGGYSINNTVFDGNIELLEPKTVLGLTTIAISGRDTTSKLLNSTVRKNLNFASDIVHSTMNPKLNTVALTSSTPTHASTGNTVTFSES